MPVRRAALVTLGCARNEVDSEELAGRLVRDGWTIVDDAGQADAVVVNTCGFIAAAKKDSIDAVLEASDGTRPVVAVGCLAERYGRELADALPEAGAVLGFDAYPDISDHLQAVLDGRPPATHLPRDRRQLLPITPAERGAGQLAGSVPGHASGRGGGGGPAHLGTILRHRLATGPVAPVKLASGCDRRCAFCAIPSFRGAFLSRPLEDVLAEAESLAADGVREIVLVSENSTAYGKDLGDVRLLERLLPQLAVVDGIVRVRVAYLQPAEMRPGLLDVLLGTDGVAGYLDLSFQHASGPLLRRMRRFGDAERFLELLAEARARDPQVGVRSNVILGFPGETRADVAILVRFLEQARLDAVGVFGYSDEEGTEAASMTPKVSSATIRRRVARLTDLVEQLTAERAEQRVGSEVEVLVEDVSAAATDDGEGLLAEGRAAHQAPEVDGSCRLIQDLGAPPDLPPLQVGDLVRGRVLAAEGVDLAVRPTAIVDAASRPRVRAA